VPTVLISERLNSRLQPAFAVEESDELERLTTPGVGPQTFPLRSGQILCGSETAVRDNWQRLVANWGYFVLAPSTFSFSRTLACAAAKRAVSTRNGEHET
jgi:hypothetical protein